MNKDQSNGKWKQLKGKAMKTWGKLAGDNAEEAEGSTEELHGIIQEKVGDAEETFKEIIDKLHVKSFETPVTAEQRDEKGDGASPTVKILRRNLCCG